jgi:hypothetical protein
VQRSARSNPPRFRRTAESDSRRLPAGCDPEGGASRTQPRHPRIEAPGPLGLQIPDHPRSDIGTAGLSDTGMLYPDKVELLSVTRRLGRGARVLIVDVSPSYEYFCSSC